MKKGIIFSILLVVFSAYGAVPRITEQNKTYFKDSGSSFKIGLQPPPLISSYNLTLPNSTGTLNQVLATDGNGILSWVTPASGGGSPGGITGNIQFNNAGSFHGTNNLFWDNINFRLGINTATPSSSLDIKSSSIATISLKSTTDSTNSSIEIGTGSTGNRSSLIDLTGDDTYTDYGLRILRSGTANGNSEINHRGTGVLKLSTLEAGNIEFNTNNTKRFTIGSNGDLVQRITHGTSQVLELSALDNGGASGVARLNTWISEPGLTWTGAGIARNRRNTNGSLPRENTGIGSQMMHFTEDNKIEFSTMTNAGTELTPLSITSAGTLVTPTLHNNASCIGATGGTQQICSGNFTPIYTCISGCNSISSAGISTYIRTGKIVTITGNFAFNSPGGGYGTVHTVTITLPITGTIINGTGSGGSYLPGMGCSIGNTSTTLSLTCGSSSTYAARLVYVGWSASYEVQ